MPTKLIEVALPLDAINREAAREKSIRQGHPSTLHLWWARRPLAACRAVLFAQLVDDPSAHPELFPTEADQERERKRLFAIMERLVPWEATRDEKVLEEARAEIRRWYPEGLPPVVDPFCGGGSIPLEALRLGLKVHASDLNPVAVLITKALIEIPSKFADRPPVHPESELILRGTQSWRGTKGLAEDIQFYGEWLRDEAKRRIGQLYPPAMLPDGSQSRVIAWLWARTVTCPNPACRADMPLSRGFWLDKAKGREAWLQATPDMARRRVSFRIEHGRQGPQIEGTVGRTGATCLVCGNAVPLTYIRQEGRAGQLSSQLLALVVEGRRHRIYLPATDDQQAAAIVDKPDGVPEEELSYQPRDIKPPTYGMKRHADLFTNRQLVALSTFSNLVSETREKVLTDSRGDVEYAGAVATYLAFAVDKCANLWSSVTSWMTDRGAFRETFARQAIPMVWDFAEANPMTDLGGGYGTAVGRIARVVADVPSGHGYASQSDAATFDFSGSIVCTDPPYYDNIGYADLSDYFYVWLRRSLREIYPELLATVLTPKNAELIAAPFRFGGDIQRAEDHFESGFRKVFQHAADEAAADIPMSVFYAFKQSEAHDSEIEGEAATASTGWEKMLEGMIQSGLQVTGTWPMRTESPGRALAQGLNALASSIVLVCRPRSTAAGMTDRRGFIQALRSRLGQALRDLQSGGVAPVDLAQAAIGPGMAVFSSYAKVVEPDGAGMRVRTALSLINQVLDEVATEQEGEFDEYTRWAVAWYADQGYDDGAFGRADDLSRAKNVSVQGLVSAGLVKSGGGKVRLLDRDELDAAWDPITDSRLTVWEITQHLIRRLFSGGEASAAELLSRVGGLGDAARDLAYRLFLIAESKKWAKEAGPYNALAASWLEISKLAAARPSDQGSLFEGSRIDGAQ